jgi:hypothetical protein
MATRASDRNQRRPRQKRQWSSGCELHAAEGGGGERRHPRGRDGMGVEEDEDERKGKEAEPDVETTEVLASPGEEKRKTQDGGGGWYLASTEVATGQAGRRVSHRGRGGRGV